MSIRIMSQVWDQYHGPAVRKLVLLCLADFSDDRGIAWPSLPSIARKSDLALSTVRTHIRSLEREGILASRGYSGPDYQHTVRYQITPPPESGAPPESGPHRNRPPTPTGLDPTPPPAAGANPSSKSVSNPPGGKDKESPRYKFMGLLAEIGMAVSKWDDQKAWEGLLRDHKVKAATFIDAIETIRNRYAESGKALRYAWQYRADLPAAIETINLKAQA